MFRLIQLHSENGVPRIGVDNDGFAGAGLALARFRAAPGTWFGVGRFDHEGTLAEVILDRLCGPLGDCPRPATLVHAQTFQRLCELCALGLDVLTVPELARLLGIACRLTPPLARHGRARPAPLTGDEPAPPGNRIARELASEVSDGRWRARLCAELAATPGALNGLLIGVGALTHRDVLDLYPRLRELGDELPAAVRDELARATARPMSPAGVTGLRLGLSSSDRQQ
jgi:hypothetical protein